MKPLEVDNEGRSLQWVLVTPSCKFQQQLFKAQQRRPERRTKLIMHALIRCAIVCFMLIADRHLTGSTTTSSLRTVRRTLCAIRIHEAVSVDGLKAGMLIWQRSPQIHYLPHLQYVVVEHTSPQTGYKVGSLFGLGSSFDEVYSP